VCLLFFLLIVGIAVIISQDKQKAEFTAIYLQETNQIVVNTTRPSGQFNPYEYENRTSNVEKIISLTEQRTEGDVDIFIFDIVGSGVAELVFFSIDSQNASDKYKLSQGLEIAITDEAVNLNNVLWRR